VIRAKLEADLKEEQAKAVALTTTLAELQKQNQAINARLLAAESESRDWEAKYHALDTEYQSLADVKANLVQQAQGAKTKLAQWTIKAEVWEADQRQHEDQTARLSQLQSELLRLESLLRDANAERNRFETALREDNARALAENDTLVAELKELKRKHVERAPVPSSAAHQGSSLVRNSAAEAAPSGSVRPLRGGSMVAQPKKSARRSHLC
jgi:chromosome segregation ATPase